MNKAEVLRYMREECHEHVDPRTGELNCTTLAEDAAQALDLYENNPEQQIPEEIFGMASEVNEERAAVRSFNGMCKQRR